MRLDPLVRFLKVHRMLSRTTGATILEMMEGTGVSRATLYRFLGAVDASGDVLEKEELPSRHIRYRILDPFHARKGSEHAFRIARTELIAVQFVRHYARLFRGTELEEDVDNVFEKIEASVDPKHYRMLRRLDRLFIPALKGTKDYTSGKTAANIDTLANAILMERTCRTSYHSFSNDTLKNLLLDPLHFFEQDGGLYLFARAEGYKDVRMYAVERFRSVEINEHGFEYPKGFDPVQLLERSFTIFDEEPPTKFVIRFSAGQAKYIAERRWAKGQKIKKQPDGSIIFTMVTTGRGDIIRWVLGYGAEAELLEPVDLRKEIVNTLTLSTNKYLERG